LTALHAGLVELGIAVPPLEVWLRPCWWVHEDAEKAGETA
jgi:hypothetical protein